MLVLVEDDEFVTLHLTRDRVETNPRDSIDSDSKGTGIQQIIKQLSFVTFQWIIENNIHSRYINGIEYPSLVVAIFGERNSVYYYLLSHVIS